LPGLHSPTRPPIDEGVDDWDVCGTCQWSTEGSEDKRMSYRSLVCCSEQPRCFVQSCDETSLSFILQDFVHAQLSKLLLWGAGGAVTAVGSAAWSYTSRPQLQSRAGSEFMASCPCSSLTGSAQRFATPPRLPALLTLNHMMYSNTVAPTHLGGPHRVLGGVLPERSFRSDIPGCPETQAGDGMRQGMRCGERAKWKGREFSRVVRST
jgi:hypothetical protein